MSFVHRFAFVRGCVLWVLILAKFYFLSSHFSFMPLKILLRRLSIIRKLFPILRFLFLGIQIPKDGNSHIWDQRSHIWESSIGMVLASAPKGALRGSHSHFWESIFSFLRIHIPIFEKVRFPLLRTRIPLMGNLIQPQIRSPIPSTPQPHRASGINQTYNCICKVSRIRDIDSHHWDRQQYGNRDSFALRHLRA